MDTLFRVTKFNASVLVCVWSLAACSGSIQTEDRPSPGAQGGGNGAPLDPNFTPQGSADVNRLSCKNDGIAVASTPLRRLTRKQYINTLTDLMGEIADVPSDLQLPDEAFEGGFDNNAATQTSTLALLQGYRRASLEMAKLATGSAQRLGMLAPCAQGQAEDGCAETFVRDFGKRAFRRPLSEDESQRLLKVFAAVKSDFGYAQGIEATLTAMLMAPQFLFRPEYGEAAEGNALKLSAYEVASRLSYLLWDSMPDADLMAAADANKLQTADQVEAQLKRMLDDPRARQTVQRFLSQWLAMEKFAKLEKDPESFPDFTDATKASLRSSMEKFVDHAFWEKGSLHAMLTDSSVFIDDKLAPIYDAPGSPDMERVTLDGSKRAGILTQAGLMAALANATYDSPIHRGLFVIHNLLCMDIPAPPADTPAFVEPQMGDAPRTTRERVELTHSDPKCAACHNLIDGIGFGFGNYDAVGAYREQENGFDINATGELKGTRDVDGAFDGAVELSKKLAQSSQVQQCFATQWYRYGFGKTETEADDCALAPIVDAFVESRGDVKHLLSVLVRSDAFRYRDAL